jgi:phosphoribosylamine--glycine ligase
MQTPDGPKLVEINARFGDPEGINVLALLQSSFLSLCEAITQGRLDELELEFVPEGTVCKYLTPQSYPEAPVEDSPLHIDELAIEREGVQLYFAKVNELNGRIVTTRSRSIALLGLASSVELAEQKVRRAVEFIKGDYHMRRDIGTRGLMEHDVDMLREARSMVAAQGGR